MFVDLGLVEAFDIPIEALRKFLWEVSQVAIGVFWSLTETQTQNAFLCTNKFCFIFIWRCDTSQKYMLV